MRRAHSGAACLALLAVTASAAAAGPERPASGAIVFASTRSVDYGSEDVFAIDRRGRRLNLTQTAEIQEEALDLSPDGREVLVHRIARHTDQDLFVLGLADRRLRRLTATPTEREHSAKFSPTGDAVAFVRGDRPNREDLWVTDQAGVERRLTSDGKDKNSVAWSPNGRRLAFVQNSTIFLVDRTGGEPVRLASLRSSLASPLLLWRRDGIIAPVERPNAAYALRLIPTDGRASRLVRNPCGGPPPVWSTDRSHVACVGLSARRALVRTAGGRLVRRATLYPATHSTQVEGVRLGPKGRPLVFSAYVDERDADLWVLDGRLSKLTTGPGEDHDPAWSPDRRRIAFVRSAFQFRSGKSGRLLLLDVATGRVRPWRTGLVGAEPDWSPDGRSLVYQRGGDLYVERLGRGGPSRLTRGRAEDTDPVWSHDGTRIAFVRHDRRTELSTIPARGGRRTVLFARQGDLLDLAWSPDDRALAFSTLHSIHVIDVATRRVESVVRDEDNRLRRLSWSADGRSLVYAAGYENDMPSPWVAPNAHHLAIWRVDLADRSTRPLIRSAGFDYDPDVAR
jgi:Tol biopolymer transport system component